MNAIAFLVLLLISFNTVFADCVKGDSKCGVDGQTYICSTTHSNAGEWQKKENTSQNCEPNPYVFSSEEEMKESCTEGDKKCAMDGTIYECFLGGIWSPGSGKCVGSAFNENTFGLTAGRRNSATGKPKQNAAESSKSLTQTKEIENVRSFLNSFTGQINALKEDYKKQLITVGFENVLNPDKLKNENMIKKSLAAIQDAKRIAQAFKATNNNNLEHGRMDLKGLAINEQLKQKVEKEFDIAAIQWTISTNQAWDEELKIITECEPILQMLLDNKSHWQIKDKTIVFDDNKYQEAFKTHVTNINNFSKEEEWLNKLGLNLFNNRMSSILN